MPNNDNPSWWPKPFRYTLTYGDVSTVLEYEPLTWNDFSLSWEMDKKYWGRTLTLGIPTKFVKDGKTIIDSAYRDKGISANVVFTIEMFDYSYNVMQYKALYSNRLDFTTIVIERDFTELAAMPQGVMTLLASKEKQEYEIEMSGASSINYDRLKLKQSYYMSMIWIDNHTTENNYFTPDIIVKDEREIVSIDGRDSIEFQSVPFYNANFDNIIGKEVWLFKSNIDLDDFKLDFVGNGTIYMNSSMDITNHSIKIGIYENNGGTTNKIFEQGLTISDFIGGAHIVKDIVVSTTLSIKAGRKYYVVFESTLNGVALVKSTNQDSYSMSRYDYRGKPKNINVLTPTQLGSRLLQKLIDEGSANASFTAIPANYIEETFGITSGDAIRGISGAKIKTSFNDFYDTYARLFQMGLDISKNASGAEDVKLMPLSHFFQNVEIMNLGEVVGMQVRPWKYKLYNSIVVGQEDVSYENTNGRGEFNTELNFTTSINETNEKLDIKTPYRRDSYGVEFVLVDFEDKGTDDSKEDNTIFVIKHNGAGVDRSSTISGTYSDDTMFNAKLSPKQTLIRNSSLLSSCLDKSPKVITFTSSKKESVTSNGTHIDGVKENSDLSVESATQYFRPMLFMFETGLKNFNPHALLSSAGSNPNGYFSFSFMGKNYKGFLKELKVKPAINQAQEWTLICHPAISI